MTGKNYKNQRLIVASLPKLLTMGLAWSTLSGL